MCRKGLFMSSVAMRSVSLSGIGVWGCYWNPLEEVDENQCYFVSVESLPL